MMDNQAEPRIEAGSEQAEQAESPIQLAFGFGDEGQPERESDSGTTEGIPARADATDQPAVVDNPKLDLNKIRDLILLAHEDVVPELVTGKTFEELLASVEPARQAFQQIVERIVNSGPKPSAEPVAVEALKTSPIPAGQPGRAATHDPHVASLNPSAKIAEGLRRKAG